MVVNRKKRERVRGISSVAVVIHPQHPTVMTDNIGNAMLKARDQGQPPLLLVPLATKREDSESIKGGMPILLLLLLLLDLETNLHLHRDSVENHPPLHQGSHVDSKDRVPAQKDDTDMILHPLLPPPLPLLLVLQEGEDMKLPIKKTRDPTHLNKGPLPKKRMKKGRKLAHLLLDSGKQSPVVPLLPPPLPHLPETGKEKFLALPQYMHLPLPHPRLEVETRIGMSKGGQDPIP